ncbi:MAG TPA: hypothetical protein VKA25_07270 [Gemmatimonadales bacterium]|nr:hypothetical protein [Gemmatimonadales bacterium]
MTSLTVRDARQFVQEAELPPAPPALRASRDPSLAPVFDGTKNQAAVVGSDVVSFVTGVTPERREAIVNSSLLAQLVAKHKIPDATRIKEWYDEYFDVLANIGWVIQHRDSAMYRESSKNLETHKAILAVATTVLGAAPTALALVKTTLDALRSMDKDSPWITIFNKESQHARTARFQVSLAHEDSAGQFMVTLMAFGLEAKSTITQVLFFRVKKNDAVLRHYSGEVTINTGVLDSVREPLKAKLAAHASQFIAKLPDLSG